LINVFKKLVVVPQMIIVTHDIGLQEAADKIFTLKKERGVSKLEPAEI
jgi:DNA repair exonuclease SbcCD ATPase subunit